MIGPGVGGSERGLEKEREIQRRCLACACIQLLKVTSLHRLILPLSSPLFSPCFSVCTVYPDATESLTVTSPCLGAVNSITSEQLQCIHSGEDTCVLPGLSGCGDSFHMKMVSLGDERV